MPKLAFPAAAQELLAVQRSKANALVEELALLRQQQVTNNPKLLLAASLVHEVVPAHAADQVRGLLVDHGPLCVPEVCCCL
jgi:hypothetical protein